MIRFLSSLLRIISYLLYIFIWWYAASVVAWFTRDIWSIPGIVVLLFGAYIGYRGIKRSAGPEDERH